MTQVFTQAQSIFLGLQESLTAKLREFDPSLHFVEDKWDRPEGGGGVSRVLTEGKVFDKAGVNFSDVEGELSEEAALNQFGVSQKVSFRAVGISSVIHSFNPKVPAMHCNLRYFETKQHSWFGGGIDVTPYYIFEGDISAYHRGLKTCCDRHQPGLYGCLKEWCDRYFYLPHRKEHRGIGGIFFDYVGKDPLPLTPPSLDQSPESFVTVVRDFGDLFPRLYANLVAQRAEEPFSEAQKQFQLYRRGRYAEFNLLYDRGTQFGLRSNGRVESIFVSLPPLCRWDYCATFAEGSEEVKLEQTLASARAWA